MESAMKNFARPTALVLVATVTITTAYAGWSGSAAFRSARAIPTAAVALSDSQPKAVRALPHAGTPAPALILAVRNAPPLCEDSVCQAGLFGLQGSQSQFGPVILSSVQSPGSAILLGPSEAIADAQFGEPRDALNFATSSGVGPSPLAAPAPEISTAAMVALGAILLIARRTGRSRWASWKAPWTPSALHAPC
jgi:hypothetical protein